MKNYFFLWSILAFLFLAVSVAGAQEANEPDLSGSQPTLKTDADRFPVYSANGAIGYTTTGQYVKSTALNGDLKLGREGHWTNHFVNAGITYGNVVYPEGDPVLNANRYFGNYKFEGYVLSNKKPYLWTLLGAESDQFQGFWGRYNAEGGLGYSFFGVAKHILKTEIGYAFVDTNWMEKQEIDDNEFHYWEPTHNSLVRLIASVPILEYILFAEEASYRHNIEDENDYAVASDTSLSFRLTSKLSFKTAVNVTYTNQPGLVEALDPYGNVIVYDNDGDATTADIA